MQKYKKYRNAQLYGCKKLIEVFLIKHARRLYLELL